MLKKLLITTLITITILGIVGGYMFYKSPNHQPPAQASQKPIMLDIALKDGKTVAGPASYLIKPNTPVEFRITSNILGRIGAPVDPPQIINFTSSPLVFHFTPTKPGSFPITYQATSSKDVIVIGTVTVRNN